jgi:LPS O-antigen subunit length determinant protein (WzzB/FepE family)
MTILHFTPEEFATFVLTFLMDKTINPDEVVTKDNRFNTFIEKYSGRFKSILMQYYLDSDAIERMQYKRVKDIFQLGADNKKSHTIRITPSKTKKEKEKERGFLKKLIAKILGNESLDVEDKNLILEYLDIENENVDIEKENEVKEETETTEKWVKDYIKNDRHGSWSSFRHAVARRLGIIKPVDPKHPLRWESPSRQWSIPEEYLEAYKKYSGHAIKFRSDGK